jgi:hypothetical protein
MRSSHHHQREYPLTFNMSRRITDKVKGDALRCCFWSKNTIGRLLNGPRSPDEHNMCGSLLHKILVMHDTAYLFHGLAA